ncbi:phosphotransferase enzyme family protein [Bifidobacterium gallicum]|uniref:Phosphotransferase n=1 Tax=Bifidobacterium gallicum DSM 20093 = LMG 11596 TaxID=561180 RepID=D1NV76_9BIFI|nr:phosphotransferase [Bifidobacterium gallicum]EFA22727.1 phosphotransferase enzyme family [Bifidobacterium gallicum DSM 20093 = LMG 11596]KFI59675.1 phosphotransferase [Bifidobacterium gallicum DSM 20093 = LMG 11596]
MPQAIMSLLDNPVDVLSLDTFSDLAKGSPAPYWLFQGVCGAWGIEPERAQLNLITVSENATFVLLLDGKEAGVVRVSQPGYVGGADAVASEICWLAALHDVQGVRLIKPVPTVRGTFVTKIRDTNGVGWTVVSTKFVEGTVLEDLDNPAPYYETIGQWAAKFHDQSRSWTAPFGFRRFHWDIADMVGPAPRWGRWETAGLSDIDKEICEKALWKALSVMMQAPRTPDSWGLIHADLRPSNIIRADNGELTVIDFDDAGYSWYLYDYASSLSFIEHESYASDLAKAWVRGYESVAGEFTDEQREIMSALSMIRRLQMLGWTTNHREDALPDGLAAAQALGSVLCAHRYLADSQWLLH